MDNSCYADSSTCPGMGKQRGLLVVGQAHRAHLAHPPSECSTGAPASDTEMLRNKQYTGRHPGAAVGEQVGVLRDDSMHVVVQGQEGHLGICLVRSHNVLHPSMLQSLHAARGAELIVCGGRCQAAGFRPHARSRVEYAWILWHVSRCEAPDAMYAELACACCTSAQLERAPIHMRYLSQGPVVQTQHTPAQAQCEGCCTSPSQLMAAVYSAAYPVGR